MKPRIVFAKGNVEATIPLSFQLTKVQKGQTVWGIGAMRQSHRAQPLNSWALEVHSIQLALIWAAFACRYDLHSLRYIHLLQPYINLLNINRALELEELQSQLRRNSH
jgi:hypothetical protein